MKDRQLILIVFAFGIVVSLAADAPKFPGEYADKSYLNGQGVIQMSLEEAGSKVSVWFSTSYNDGHGCAPEANGYGVVKGKGILEFSFHDSSKNTGSGTITLTSDGVAVSLKLNSVADQQCVELYKQNIRLKRLKK